MTKVRFEVNTSKTQSISNLILSDSAYNEEEQIESTIVDTIKVLLQNHVNLEWKIAVTLSDKLLD